MIAPWRGESEWFPVSNPASCWDVDVRERTDGVGVSSGGRDVYTRCPLARPFRGSPPMSAGATPSRVHIWVSPHSLILAVSLQLSACMCVCRVQLASVLNGIVCYECREHENEAGVMCARCEVFAWCDHLRVGVL